ncbi:hypothetical protein Tco_0069002 [Tanacetum coccineum]
MSKQGDAKKDEAEISDATLKYPPGFTPVADDDIKSNSVDNLVREENASNLKVHEEKSIPGVKNSRSMSPSKEEDKECGCSSRFRRVKGPKTGGSILHLLNDLVKVGQTMRYKMDGCVRNIEEIIETRGENEMNFLSLNVQGLTQRLKRLGEILCVWDPRMFRKNNSTVSDYFVAIQGVWIPNSMNCLIVSVYAPQEVCEKKML